MITRLQIYIAITLLIFHSAVPYTYSETPDHQLHFPMQSGPEEAERKSGALIIENAVFRSNALQLQGKYPDESVCTPSLSGFDLSDFSISSEFHPKKIRGYMDFQPIMAVGRSCRHFSVGLNRQGYLSVRVRNGARTYKCHDRPLTDTWHHVEARMVNNIAEVLLNGEVTCRIKVDLDFECLSNYGSPQVCVSDYGLGSSFHEELKNWRIGKGHIPGRPDPGTTTDTEEPDTVTEGLTPRQQRASETCISSQEKELYDLMMNYRSSLGLSSIPLSKSMTYVAQKHILDLANNNPHGGACNMHSWSDQSASGEWSGCCYTGDHAQARCMWNKPRELTDFDTNGYEIAAGGGGFYYSGSADYYLRLWQGSPPHHATIINQPPWNDPWEAVGFGFMGSYAVVWFANKKDPLGSPELCAE